MTLTLYKTSVSDRSCDVLTSGPGFPPLNDDDMALHHSGSHRQDSRTYPVRPPMQHSSSRRDTLGQDFSNGNNQPRRRIAVACSRCRKRKIKCSGDLGNGNGCTNCRSAGVDINQCQFHRVGSYVYPPQIMTTIPHQYHGAPVISPNIQIGGTSSHPDYSKSFPAPACSRALYPWAPYQEEPSLEGFTFPPATYVGPQDFQNPSFHSSVGPKHDAAMLPGYLLEAEGHPSYPSGPLSELGISVPRPLSTASDAMSPFGMNTLHSSLPGANVDRQLPVPPAFRGSIPTRNSDDRLPRSSPGSDSPTLKNRLHGTSFLPSVLMAPPDSKILSSSVPSSTPSSVPPPHDGTLVGYESLVTGAESSINNNLTSIACANTNVARSDSAASPPTSSNTAPYITTSTTTLPSSSSSSTVGITDPPTPIPTRPDSSASTTYYTFALDDLSKRRSLGDVSVSTSTSTSSSTTSSSATASSTVAAANNRIMHPPIPSVAASSILASNGQQQQQQQQQPQAKRYVPMCQSAGPPLLHHASSLDSMHTTAQAYEEKLKADRQPGLGRGC